MAYVMLVLALALVFAVPAWPHSRRWGFYPASALGLLLAIVALLSLAGNG
jgi:hypothetical protein